MFIKLFPLNLSIFGTPCTVRPLVCSIIDFSEEHSANCTLYILISYARIINKKKKKNEYPNISHAWRNTHRYGNAYVERNQSIPGQLLHVS